jgi:hypothetical protein
MEYFQKKEENSPGGRANVKFSTAEAGRGELCNMQMHKSAYN